MLVWFIFDLPLTMLGVYVGFHQKTYLVKNRPSRVPRESKPDNSCVTNPVLCFFISSVLPFVAIAYQFY